MWIAYVATKGNEGSEWRPMVLQSQVRCGSVYVTSEDSAQKVTQTVVTATSVAEKKKRASKYTVAVGTSHGHVQAFLEDADSVLAALDQCPAEEKCLMLIKRPKESARKMLKSHSWANLSVSDPQLYRQFNGVQLSQVHHPAPIYKGRRLSDEHSVTSNDTDRSDGPRRRYISARGNKENHKQQQQHQQQQPHRGPYNDNHNNSQDYYHSDSSSVASDYQYVPRRERERDRDYSRRDDLRYSSIPEDAQEINNNSDKGTNSAMYHSCHDVSFSSQASSANRSDWGRQGQGQEHPGQGRPGQGQLTSDQMYGSPVKPVHDPGDIEEGARSQSLGNLSTGLTLSLVGQRKADSMLDLTASPPSSSSSSQQQQQQHPPPRSQAPRPRRSDGGNLPHNVRSPDKCMQSPRHSYPESIRSPGAGGRDEVFSPPRDANGYYNGVQSPPHYQKYPQNYQPNYGPGGQRGSHHGQSNGYTYGNSSSGSSTSREQTPQSDTGGPPKPKRNLPYVHPDESLERIKRFTEMMKSRMSVCSSSAGRSTANSIGSQTCTTPQTPVSRQASVNTDNTSDCEVSTLLDVRMLDGGYSSPNKHPSENGGMGPGRPPQHPQDLRAKEDEAREKNQLHVYPARHPASSQETPQSFGDSMSESTQSRFTSHSHSSTMDSGYTTNTEGDADSTNTSHQLSPPHHLHPHSHQQHSHQQHPLHLHPNHPPSSHPTVPHSNHPSNSYVHHLSNSHANHPVNPHPAHHSNVHPGPAPPYSHHPPHPSKPHHPQASNSQPNHSGQQQHPNHPPPPPPQYQNHHPHHPPQSVPAEPVRPVPIPRNLSLANSRKFSSMQNVSSVHGQQLSYPSGPPPQPQPRDWGDGKGQNAPQSKGPGPVRAQHSMNSVDYPLVAEHQRRSWDLSHHFKSLDFVPLTDGGGKPAAAVVAQPREDHVVKPQAVSVNSVMRQGLGSPRRTHPPQQRREVQENGQSKRGSWQEQRNQEKPPPLPLSQPPPPLPLSQPPPPPPPAADTNGVTTLPGHWKYNNANNVNAVNNNTTHTTTTSISNSASTSTSNNSNASSPKSPPKPSTDAPPSPPAVSLYQLSQGYDLCSVKLSLPGNLNANTLLTLSTLQVTLPVMNLENSAAPVHSPQGRCARLGGPGSAFRPVKMGGAAGQTTVAVAAVGSVDKQCKQLCSLGEIHAGDLLVEINGRQCIGWDLPSVQSVLDSAQGEIMLGIARTKKDQIDNRVQQLEGSLQKLELEVRRLNEELAKKDSRILELSTMLPWKANEESSGGKVILESEEGAFVIGDNEFVV